MKRIAKLCSGALAATLLATVASAAPLFSDDFNVNSAGSYTVNQDADTTVTFAYDYSADGIPPAPGQGGTTRGVRFSANSGDTTATAAAANISPTGGNYTGDYRLRFYSWLNANGPFPGGGVGSTEFVTGGIENSGTAVQKSVTGSSANGPWFAGSNEGGATGDYRAYQTLALQVDSSTVYAAPNPSVPANTRRESSNPYYHTAIPGVQMAPASQQAAFPGPTAGMDQTGATAAGSLGFAWQLHEISKVGSAVSWTINGLPIATFPTPTVGGSNVFVGHWDAFASIADNAAVSFGIIDNLTVVQINVPEPSTLALGGLALVGIVAVRRRRMA